MPCGLCHRKEPCADEQKDYLCGTCVCLMMGRDRDQKRMFIDSLYMKDMEEEALFLEKMFYGMVSKSESTTPKPKLLIRKHV